ncbi:MAG TPA: NAD-dependent epimerase/dehydratase family protein [Candidatus Saccharimonadales bacterium]|nr:NAD-dependent epimerase/dehydratase family protein [Candidatus Saccharimonadales bacterium]
MKLLVTGGAGFVGSAFVRSLMNAPAPDEVIVLDKLTYAGRAINIRNGGNGQKVVLVVGDVLDTELVYHLLSDVQVVVHFAAESHNTRSETDPDLFYRTNVGGTRSVMDACQKYQKDFPHGPFQVVHVSTDEVYGPAQPGVFFKEEDFGQPGNQPTSPYSKSKFEADAAVRTTYADLKPVVIRPTNNFGPYQNPEKALPRWICAALQNRPLKVWGTGQQVRDWLYTGDTVRAIKALLHDHQAGPFNIGANHLPEITNLEIAQKVLYILGKPRSLIDMVGDPRPDHDFRYGVDTGKLLSGGYFAGWPGKFEQQLEETVRWYSDHDWWWKPLIAEAEALYKDKEKS